MHAAPSTAATPLVSKVLVVEHDTGCLARLKTFCDGHGLAGLKAQATNLLAVLGSNVDLGAVLLAEGAGREAAVALARQIHRARPELPIFLRQEGTSTLEDLPAQDRALFCAGYHIEHLGELTAAIDRWLFSRAYPPALVRGVAEITAAVLRSQFKGVDVREEPPHLVRDRIIHGEVYTMIPLESQWCRGYMTLEAPQADLLRLVAEGRTGADAHGAGIRTINHVFGEVTNLVWGAFRNRFVALDDRVGHVAQVPIVVNHEQRYISFGSDDPQLCFRYRLADPRDAAWAPVTIVQRFIFNLNWSPEDFRENQESLDALVEAGELELF